MTSTLLFTLAVMTIPCLSSCPSDDPTVSSAVATEKSAKPNQAATGARHQATQQPSDSEKLLLLTLARQTIQRSCSDQPPPRLEDSCCSPYLEQPLGCFVTLHTNNHRLRGCMGMFQPSTPLHQNIVSRAQAAAFEDPRFPPVTEKELASLQLEISILTKPQLLTFDSPQELLEELVPRRDGVILRTPYGSSTYLPQVWEQLTNKQTFLTHLCRKHGAPGDCWREKDIIVQTYRAIVFSETQLAHLKKKAEIFSLEGDAIHCRL